MDNNVQKEIDDLHKMIQNWKQSDLTYYTTEGPNEWILEDFIEKMSIWMFPYVRRFLDCGYITITELQNFAEKLESECDDMRRLLRLSEPEESTS